MKASHNHGAAVTPAYLELKQIRLKAGLTQVELAKKSGIPQSTISRLETAYTRAIDFDTLDRLCRVLKCEPGKLLVRPR